MDLFFGCHVVLPSGDYISLIAKVNELTPVAIALFPSVATYLLTVYFERRKRRLDSEKLRVEVETEMHDQYRQAYLSQGEDLTMQANQISEMRHALLAVENESFASMKKITEMEGQLGQIRKTLTSRDKTIKTLRAKISTKEQEIKVLKQQYGLG